jgi:hypothetical protein
LKTITPALRTHLAQPVTTLATCWHVIRTDGTSYAFTSFDDDLIVGGITYSSTAGFTRSAVQTGSSGEVDNVDLLGFFHPDAITERDLKNGLFDYATVYLFVVNWANLGQGICKLRRGWIGECTRSPAGIFHAELRGLTQALVQEFGDEFMPICRADLGDSKCKMPIKPKAWQANMAVAKGDYVQAATQPTDQLLVAIFQAQNGGTTGATEPVWDTAFDSSTPDNDVAWTSKRYWRGIGTVTGEISQRQFISSPLSVPAIDMNEETTLSSTAQIFFRAEVSAGTVVEITDGIETHSIVAQQDVGYTTAGEYVFNYFSSFNGIWGIETTGSYADLSVSFVNSSGEQANIMVTGDIHRGIVVRNFQTTPFAGGTVTWISGDNDGRSMEMKEYDSSTSTVDLWLGMYFPIRVGDRFFFYPGCDKRRDTCFYVFDNIVNFRAEPDMPMFDRMLTYPDS